MGHNGFPRHSEVRRCVVDMDKHIAMLLVSIGLRDDHFVDASRCRMRSSSTLRVSSPVVTDHQVFAANHYFVKTIELSSYENVNFLHMSMVFLFEDPSRSGSMGSSMITGGLTINLSGTAAFCYPPSGFQMIFQFLSCDL